MVRNSPEREVTYDPGFYDDLCRWRDEDPSAGRRVVELVETVARRPKGGRGRPKRLAGLPGVWSRRITRRHRLFYVARGRTVRFVSCRGHELPERVREAVRAGEDDRGR